MIKINGGLQDWLISDVVHQSKRSTKNLPDNSSPSYLIPSQAKKKDNKPIN
jgi:hypothetical protein